MNAIRLLGAALVSSLVVLVSGCLGDASEGPDQAQDELQPGTSQASSVVANAGSGVALSLSYCVPDGSWEDKLNQTSCCSGYAEPGSTVCFNPADYGTTWASCVQVCATAPVGGCIPSGGIDDVQGINHCCSGVAVHGSTHCLNPTDWGTTWKSCVQTCA